MGQPPSVSFHKAHQHETRAKHAIPPEPSLQSALATRDVLFSLSDFLLGKPRVFLNLVLRVVSFPRRLQGIASALGRAGQERAELNRDLDCSRVAVARTPPCPSLIISVAR